MSLLRLRSSARLRERVMRKAFTVVEMMIAAAVSLLLVAGLVTAFQTIGNQVRISRATLEMSGQLRMATYQIRENLDDVSVPLRPWVRVSEGEGYFEYVEGPSNDRRSAGVADSAYGDIDDILMFTARSDGEPFTGRYNGGIVESNEAEIVMWTQLDDLDGDGVQDDGEYYILHRRILLIRPDLAAPAASLDIHYRDNDVSARLESGAVVANRLVDLSLRERRFAHNAVFPSEINRATLQARVLTGDLVGTDVLLSNLLAFDIQVYDPLAVVKEATLNDQDDPAAMIVLPLVPSDAAYDDATAVAVGEGAYVDLAYATTYATGAVGSTFSGLPVPVERATPVNLATPTYCTWSFFYEQGREGTDGLDNDGLRGVDDPGERLTSPPYPTPLRGIKITVRIVDPDSQKARQASVIKDFTPE